MKTIFFVFIGLINISGCICFNHHFSESHECTLKNLFDTIPKLQLLNIKEIQSTNSTIYVDTTQREISLSYFRKHRLFMSRGLDKFLNDMNDSICIQIRSDVLLDAFNSNKIFANPHVTSSHENFINNSDDVSFFISCSKTLICGEKHFIFINIQAKQKSFYYSDILFVLNSENSVESIFSGEYVE
jgi:hypothetical protein